ncbi:MAG: hypothetical protein A2X09_17425 [Bacteroidetes bacterium GWF2_43_11]|nr:MAG: hypothetical protein A2X09_17425 [Bacteroidetes bacterium GWF2_43_11]
MQLKIGNWRNADVTRLAEQVREKKLAERKGTLYLQDLGYYKQNTFEEIDKSGNYFISKVKYGVIFYDLLGNRIDLKKILSTERQNVDIKIMIGDRVWRLIGQRAPEQAIQERVKKAKRSHRENTLSDEYRQFLNYTLYITNLPEEYNFEGVFTLYRIRWQIELIFKVWKSVLKLHKIHSAKKSRVLCEVQGKLIMATILAMLYHSLNLSSPEYHSYHKIVQFGKSLAYKWALALSSGYEAHKRFLAYLLKQLARLCKKNKQKTKPRIEDRLIILTAPPSFHLEVLKVA